MLVLPEIIKPQWNTSFITMWSWELLVYMPQMIGMLWNVASEVIRGKKKDGEVNRNHEAVNEKKRGWKGLSTSIFTAYILWYMCYIQLGIWLEKSKCNLFIRFIATASQWDHGKKAIFAWEKEEGETKMERNRDMVFLFISSPPLQQNSYRIIMSSWWQCVLDCHWWVSAGPLFQIVCVCVGLQIYESLSKL